VQHIILLDSIRASWFIYNFARLIFNPIKTCLALKQLLKDYFSFNKRERNGILVLLAIILLLIIYLNVDEYLFADRQNVDYTQFEKEIGDFLASQDQEESTNIDFIKPSSPAGERDLGSEVKLFHFNPNDITKEQWKQLGLKEWQIRAVQKYIEKAGELKTREDFRRLRAITEEQHELLQPYVLLPDKSKNNIDDKYGRGTDRSQSFDSPKKDHKLIIELNSATTEKLKKLDGIGDAYSSRIIKYRNSIGGFVNREQLLEVFGLDSVLYDQISGHIEVNPNMVRRININKCSIYQLKKHPYISFNVANAIVNYRDSHGEYTDISQIRKTDLVNEELYLKIVPYLMID